VAQPNSESAAPIGPARRQAHCLADIRADLMTPAVLRGTLTLELHEDEIRRIRSPLWVSP
jgi:hypothetical protein